MAIAQTGGVVTAGNQTAAATLVLTVAANIAVGETVIVFIGADNAGTAGASSISSVTDTGGNTYTQLRLQNRTAASAANDGCTAAIYASKITTALTAGQAITVNFSPNTTAKCAQFIRFTGVTNVTGYGAASSSGTGAAFTSGASGTVLNGDLALACAANESATAPVNDTDTTNGGWANLGGVSSAGSGGDATKMGVRGSFKIVTADGAQTWDAGTGASTDWAACICALSGAAAGPVVSLDGESNVAAEADASTLIRARGLGTAAGTASEADASTLIRARGLAARAGTAAEADVSTLIRARGLAAGAGTAAGASATLATTAGAPVALAGRAGTATGARAAPLAARPFSGRAGTATDADASTSQILRAVLTRPSTASGARAASLTARPIQGRSGTATGALGALVTTAPNVVSLAGRAATATGARAAPQTIRPVLGRARAATGAVAALSTAGPNFVTFAGRARAGTGARPTLIVTRPFVIRAPTVATASAVFTVWTALPPPGRFATFRNQVADVLDGLGPSDEHVFAEFRAIVAGVLDSPPDPAGTLTRLRLRVVEALMIDAGWEVHPLPVDSVTPPCFMLEWADPWHNPATHCFTDAHLDVICIAPRIEPDPGIETLELMVESALGALHRAGIPCGEGSAPRPFEIGGITYLACRIPVHNTVNVGV